MIPPLAPLIIAVGLVGLLSLPVLLVAFAVKSRQAPWTPLHLRVAQDSNPEPTV